jgi:hypothetical protein
MLYCARLGCVNLEGLLVAQMFKIYLQNTQIDFSYK